MNNNNIKYKQNSSHKRGLRVGCINVRGLVGNPTKRIDLNCWLEIHDLDVICIQEWYIFQDKIVINENMKEDKKNDDFGLAPLKVELKMAAFQNYQKVEHDNKTLILYKNNLEVITFDHFEKIKDVGLDISWLGVVTNRKIVVIGSGYHSPSHDNVYDNIKKQQNRIKRELADKKLKVVFMINGDFNCKHHYWGSSITDNRGEYMLDWMGENNFDTLNNGDYTYKTNTGKNEVLDLMLIENEHQDLVTEWSVHTVRSSRTKKTRSGRVRIPFSDHRGMIAIINLDPKMVSKPDRITWNLDESKKVEYQKKLKENMKLWYIEYLKLKQYPKYVDHLVEYFQLLITKTAREVFGFKRFNSQSVNWVDKKVYIILQEKRKMRNKLSHHLAKMKKNPNKRNREMKRKLKRIKHRLNRLKKKLNKHKYSNILKSTKKMEKLINDPNVNKEKLFYDTINKISNKAMTSIPPLRDKKNDNVIATTNEEIADTLHRHYCKPIQRNVYEPKHIAFHEHVDNFMNNYNKNKNKNDNIVNRAFEEQEIMHVINNINRHSAMAFDLIHYELLYWGKYQLKFCLTKLFNLCYYEHQKCPKVWKYAEYTPVPKPGRVPYYCGNIRPISIIPGLARVMGKLLCNRILTDCIERKILSKNNCAFQCNKSPQDIVNNFVEKTYQAYQNGHFMVINQMDLASAYDSVVANSLLYRMINEYDFDGNIIAWYKEALYGRKTRVKYKDCITKWRDSLNNLPQGQTDSTILFDLMLNNIDLVDVDKMARILKELDEMEEKRKIEIKEKLDEYSDYDGDEKEEEKAVNDYEITTKGEYGNKEKYREYKKYIYKKTKVNWNEVEFNPNLINDDDKTLKIAKFRAEAFNFADDCSLEMNPLLHKKQLTKYINYGYKLNMQHGLNQFFNWIRYRRFVLKKPKCSTITFSRKKQQYHAYVYKLDGEKLDLIHSHSNGPQKCKHNARLNYVEANLELTEDNGDSDLDNLDSNGEKIVKSSSFKSMNPWNPICTIQKTGKNAAKQKRFIQQLPPTIRILGVFLDPEMFFDEHIKIVKQKAEVKLHQLLKLAFCKHYKFNPGAILKLFESVIRPRVEYALCSVSSATKFKELIKLQKRAVRIAMQVKRNTPSIMLNEIGNIKKIEHKLMEQQIKMWHKSKRAPPTMLQRDTFDRWKKYIVENDQNCKDKYGNIHLNGKTFNHVIDSPLSRCYQLIQKLYKPHQRLFVKKFDSVMKPPPTYKTPFPTNLHTTQDMNYIKILKQGTKCWNFWTDGSCIPNPGPGGAGYYSDNFVIQSKIHVVDHDTTINYCEMMGIKMVLLSVKKYLEFLDEMNQVSNKTNINIYTDSQFVFNLLNENGYPKLDYYYKLLNSIFDICHYLKEKKLHINIVKINSHIGNEGNEIADKLAKEAAIIAKQCKYRENNFIRYDMRKNHVSVDIAKDMIKLRKQLKLKREKEWRDYKRDRLNRMEDDSNNKYYGCHNFENAIIDENGRIQTRGNEMKNELQHLTQKECEIINKLRTERINLNHYLYTIGIKDDYKCKKCNHPETVDHFLLDCPGYTDKFAQQLFKNNVDYNIQRNKLKKELRKITIFFKHERNFTIQNLLFPHIWQRKLTGKGKHQDWNRDGVYYRTQILKAVAKFVMNTKRFNDDYGI